MVVDCSTRPKGSRSIRAVRPLGLPYILFFVLSNLKTIYEIENLDSPSQQVYGHYISILFFLVVFVELLFLLLVVVVEFVGISSPLKASKSDSFIEQTSNSSSILDSKPLHPLNSTIITLDVVIRSEGA